MKLTVGLSNVISAGPHGGKVNRLATGMIAHAPPLWPRRRVRDERNLCELRMYEALFL